MDRLLIITYTLLFVNQFETKYYITLNIFYMLKINSKIIKLCINIYTYIVYLKKY